MPEPHLRILVVGAASVPGRAVVAELSHDIDSARSRTGDGRIGATDPASIAAGLKAVGPQDIQGALKP